MTRCAARYAVLGLVCVLGMGCAGGGLGGARTTTEAAAKSVRAVRPPHAGSGEGSSASAADGAIDPMQGAPREKLAWASLSAETFARAKAERKYVVMDGSAEWCHWCHVMEATTYHDPDVRKLLDDRFIAVKVDVDERPDVQERYADYGWPATVVFAPDATELGKYRGYIAPDDFVAILREVVASGVAERAITTGGMTANAQDGRPSRSIGDARALAEEHLAWIARDTDLELDDYWDDAEGGWGRQQKAPLGWNNAWMLSKAATGDLSARKKALFALERQSKLIDPVWGGIYQYSAASDWDHAHVEKLMTFQAPALDNYATAYRLTGDPKMLERARAMLGYVDRFLKGPDGGFYTTQDADVNAHDREKPYMNGHDYYALDERARLARGIPRIDTHEYGRENGLAIMAYVTMYEATKDAAVLASAEKAARRILATHAVPRDRNTSRGASGSAKTLAITHAPVAKSSDATPGVAADAPSKVLLHLGDNAAFGFALLRLHEATHDEFWLKQARAIADFMLAELASPEHGGFLATTRDPDATGIFAARRVPFEENVMALRMFARLARATKSPVYSRAIDQTLRAISTPEEIKARGRWLGDYLLALEETKDVRGVAK